LVSVSAFPLLVILRIEPSSVPVKTSPRQTNRAVHSVHSRPFRLAV